MSLQLVDLLIEGVDFVVSLVEVVLKLADVFSESLVLIFESFSFC